MRKRRILAISALKGGVGKTTTAVSLAAACARAGRRVLLVDVDPQGCVGASIGLDGETGLDAWLVGEAAFEDVVARENRQNLDVVVAGARLLAAEDQLREKGKEKRRHRLERRLGELDGEAYDVVLLDCPPSASLLLENAWFAAHELVLPAKLEPLSLPALERTKRFVAAIDAGRPRPLRIDGVLPDLLRPEDSRVGRDTRRDPREVHEDPDPIRINSALAEAPRTGKTIYELDPGARGAVDYALLAEDLGLV
ncbi:MAG: ParA family protein [Holophagales bacterium]|nr:ParA family protein [Holophagales bacterium]